MMRCTPEMTQFRADVIQSKKNNAIYRKFTLLSANQMSGMNSDFKMNVMKKQIAQVTK